jgi:AcrR family transcriptional regulator
MTASVTVPFDDLSPSARIRETALRLFAERGPRNTSLRTIAEASGVSLGALVHHYRGKDALEEAVQHSVLERMHAEIQAAVDAPSEPKSAHEAYYDFMERNPVISEYVRQLQIEGNDRGLAFFREGHESARELLLKLRAEGSARPFGDEEIGLLLFSILQGGHLWFRPMIEAILGESVLNPEIQRRFRNATLELFSTPLYIDKEPKTTKASAASGVKRQPKRPTSKT